MFTNVTYQITLPPFEELMPCHFVDSSSNKLYFYYHMKTNEVYTYNDNNQTWSLSKVNHKYQILNIIFELYFNPNSIPEI
jgi:hypothetical protein